MHNNKNAIIVKTISIILRLILNVWFQINAILTENVCYVLLQIKHANIASITFIIMNNRNAIFVIQVFITIPITVIMIYNYQTV